MSYNVSKSVLAVQSQYGDESSQIPKFNNRFPTNITNTANTYQTLEFSERQAEQANQQS